MAAINEVVELELLLGHRDEGERNRIQDALKGLLMLGLSRDTWGVAAEFGTGLLRNGQPLPIPDLLIASSAIEHDAVLVHADSDFDRVARTTGRFKVESFLDQLG